MSTQYETVELTLEEVGQRLDKALAARLEGLSRVQVQALIREGCVEVNGRPAKAAYRVEGGERVRVRVPQKEAPRVQAEPIPLAVLYEDAHVAVVDKPAGMVVHPSFGHTSGTLVNAILARWPQIAEWGEAERAGIVHRLDKDTSGVILVAKTPHALAHLQAQFKARQVEKRYLALVEGIPQSSEGVIEAPIGRDPRQRKRMAVTREGREAITAFRVLELYADHALLEAFPKTGRTHQIRVHLAFIGHPVVGDTVYGRRKQRLKMKRHFLHAARITFTPSPDAPPVSVEAPLPLPLQDVLRKLPR